METILGYNIILQATIDTVKKTFAGTTSNNFSITPETKDSITKADAGVKRKVSTGYAWEITGEGLICVKETGETTLIDKNDLIEMAKNATPIDVVYGQTAVGSKVQKGTAIITAYSEATDAENEGTYNFSLGGTSQLTTETIAV